MTVTCSVIIGAHHAGREPQLKHDQGTCVGGIIRWGDWEHMLGSALIARASGLWEERKSEFVILDTLYGPSFTSSRVQVGSLGKLEANSQHTRFVAWAYTYEPQRFLLDSLMESQKERTWTISIVGQLSSPTSTAILSHYTLSHYVFQDLEWCCRRIALHPLKRAL